MVLIFSNGVMNSQSQLQTVDFEELGLSFKIPSGWNSQIDGDYMYLKHDTLSGLIVVFESRSKSTHDLLMLAKNGIHEDGVQLNSLNDFKITAENTVDGHYQGIFMDFMVKAYAIGKIDGLGSGISVLALSEPKDFNKAIKTEAQKIVASVKFYKAVQSQASEFWKDRLIGKRLKYFNTQTNTDFNGGISGISDRETLDLFNDGSFYYYTNNQSIVKSSNIGADDKASGDFRIVTLGKSTYLQLFFNGDSLEFELNVSDSNHTLLNGKRYLIDSLND